MPDHGDPQRPFVLEVQRAYLPLRLERLGDRERVGLAVGVDDLEFYLTAGGHHLEHGLDLGPQPGAHGLVPADEKADEVGDVLDGGALV